MVSFGLWCLAALVFLVLVFFGFFAGLLSWFGWGFQLLGGVFS